MVSDFSPLFIAVNKLMKIVQSSWSCNQKDLLTFKAGWYAPEYHLMGWTLSCLQLTKYYEGVVLHADGVMATMLIDTLHLPYTNVICDLDKLNNYHPQLWALPKIHTYSQQDTPFLHIDGDVMIWKPFEDKLLNSGLIAQNIEKATVYYENMMRSLKAGLIYIPSEIIAEGEKGNPVCSYNAGIFGGTDVEFFKSYANKAIAFIDRNVSCFSNIDVDAFNILFEQYLFHSMVHQGNKKVSLLFDEIIGDNEYIGFGDFAEVPHNKQYLHLIGTYKRNPRVCEQLANRLRQDYPEFYYRIIALFKNKRATLKRDYYYFISQTSEELLAKRYSMLNTGSKNNESCIAEENHINTPVIIKFREKLVKDIISGKRNQNEEIDTEAYTEFVNDANLFEDQLAATVQTKFACYPREYLYARDIAHTSYFQLIFGNRNSIYDKLIVTDPSIEIIESKFDWSEINPEHMALSALTNQIGKSPTVFNTAIIPECDQSGYSLATIDDLDLLLLQILQMPITISELLNEVKLSFDPVDLERSPTEYEQLIIGRIKLALEKKLIKAVM